jgi:excisionase family DNA binding protein
MEPTSTLPTFPPWSPAGSDATRVLGERIEATARRISGIAANLTALSEELAEIRRLAEASAARPEPLLLDVESAAQRLGISRSTLYELIRSDKLRTVTIGTRRLVPLAALGELAGAGR